MRRFSSIAVVAILICAGPVFAQGGGGPAKAKATTPEIPFETR